MYCIQPWGNAGETELNQILILQKRVVRLITGQIWSNTPSTLHPSGQLFSKLNILKINDIYPYEPNLGASGIRGVAIYYSDSLIASEVKFNVDGLEDHVWIKLTSGNCKILCGCVYRSPTITEDTSSQSTDKVTELIQTALR